MDVRVRFYLSLKEAGLPKKEMTFKVKLGTSIAELLWMISKKYPVFGKSYLSNWLGKNKEVPLLITKNDNLAKLECLIRKDEYIKISEIIGGG